MEKSDFFSAKERRRIKESQEKKPMIDIVSHIHECQLADWNHTNLPNV